MPSILNRANLEDADFRANNDSDYFNCWGATLYVLDKINALEWLPQYRMDRFLEQETKEVKAPTKIGDIVALYDSFDGLIHTAVYVGGRKFWHKVGDMDSEYTSFRGILRTYDGDFDKVVIRRQV